jgi:DNA-binding GntR family transcriptional regulator
VSETSSGPLRVRSVVGLAYDELRAMIVDGRLQPGARVGQAELADALGISRGSVREALRRLTGDGLVVFEVNRGFFVADVGLERVLERLEARLLLEPGIARLAAERRDDADLDALRRSVVAERAARTAAAAHDASRAFHAALVASARNDALTRIFDALWIADVGQRLLASRRSQPDWQEADVAEHEELLAAVEDGDGDLAESLMRAHVESAWRHWARRPTPAGADG